ncbi:uncharacterized protein [Choristoneura fumiferana]|uniref:uncharacterized protein n=1 Tax=Choristoneura fumiferana TaxID=7141 RepID=UPI003D159923
MIEAEKRGVAVALIQEPYVGSIGEMRGRRGVRVFQNTSVGDGVVKSAIAVFDQEVDVVQLPQLTTNNIVVVRIQTGAWVITLASVYLECPKHDHPIGADLDSLARIDREIGSAGWILGGDVNAKSVWWGSPVNDHRGEELAGCLDELNMAILNRGKIPTFDTIRGGKRYQSFVDITACSMNILDLIEDWRVEEGLTCSDHNGVVFHIKLEKSKGIGIIRTTRKYNSKKANWQEFNGKLNQLLRDKNITNSEIANIDNIDEIEDREGMWEGIYRVIGRTSRREEDLPLVKNGEVLDAKGSAKFLAETFYPEDLTTSDNEQHQDTRRKAEMVNAGEQVGTV